MFVLESVLFTLLRLKSQHSLHLITSKCRDKNPGMGVGLAIASLKSDQLDLKVETDVMWHSTLAYNDTTVRNSLWPKAFRFTIWKS